MRTPLSLISAAITVRTERLLGVRTTGRSFSLVNPVNCVGIMGKGIALQFKQAFPENFRHYQIACHAQQVQPGQVLVYQTHYLSLRYIINVPTKRQWHNPSLLEDIVTGLITLIDVVQLLQIQSLAMSALGCGNGGLDWQIVKPCIEAALSQLPPSIEVVVFEPTQKGTG